MELERSCTFHFFFRFPATTTSDLIRPLQFCLIGQQRKKVIKAGGIELFLELLKLYEKDEVLVAIVLKTLLSLLKENGAAEEILDKKGKDAIEMVGLSHAEDKEITKESLEVMKKLGTAGMNLAVEESRKIEKAVTLGIPLGAVDKIFNDMAGRNAKVAPMEHMSKPSMTIATTEEDALARLVESMKNFAANELMQEHNIDTLLLYSRSVDDIRPLIESNGVEALVKVMQANLESSRIQWRGCRAIADLSADASLCGELGRRGACEAAIQAFRRFEGSRAVKQHAIWAISSLCKDGEIVSHYFHCVV